MAATPQVIPFVVPAQPVPAVESITQRDLAQILELRHRIESLEAELKAAEASVRAQLETGAAVEPGLLKAFLKTTERRSVSWKAVCERELGEKYCTRVLAHTKPSETVSLIVE
jgi:hypothetical protein